MRAILGSGSYATVTEAQHKYTRARYAVKTILKKSLDKKLEESLKREIEIMSEVFIFSINSSITQISWLYTKYIRILSNIT